MPTLNCSLQGRFGNQVVQFLYAYFLAERWRYNFTCDEWIGEKVFDISCQRYTGPALRRINEMTFCAPGDTGDESVEFRGYAQMSHCTIYTKRDAQSLLKIRPEILATLGRIREHHFRRDSIVAHHRKGDFIGYSYPVVSRLSYKLAAQHYFGFSAFPQYVSEEEPTPANGLPSELAFLPDFYRLMMAPTLMRANSTFSFVAALLGNGLVLSPRIDGLQGGVEHDNVLFEAGNHCKLADFSFCSDLHISP